MSEQDSSRSSDREYWKEQSAGRWQVERVLFPAPHKVEGFL